MRDFKDLDIHTEEKMKQFELAIWIIFAFAGWFLVLYLI